MRYDNVYIEALGYELPPFVLTSEEIETALAALYEKLHLKPGQLETLTGISERRYWAPGTMVSQPAAKAGQKALDKTNIRPEQLGMLIYAGVCRDHLEPATACAVANLLKVSTDTHVFDLSNACLGVVNGMLTAANAIELGQMEAALVVSCESSRQIMDFTMERMLNEPDLDTFRKTVATLTGGSGAAAALLTNEKLSTTDHKLLGGTYKAAPEHHKLCIWGPPPGEPAGSFHKIETESVTIMNRGLELAQETYADFRREMAWPADKPDKIICHQVGAANQRHILKLLDIPIEKDFTTFPYLGNIGTVSLPLTAAIAEERGFLQPNDLVSFMGIGSGLNCMMLGIKW